MYSSMSLCTPLFAPVAAKPILCTTRNQGLASKARQQILTATTRCNLPPSRKYLTQMRRLLRTGYCVAKDPPFSFLLFDRCARKRRCGCRENTTTAKVEQAPTKTPFPTAYFVGSGATNAEKIISHLSDNQFFSERERVKEKSRTIAQVHPRTCAARITMASLHYVSGSVSVEQPVFLRVNSPGIGAKLKTHRSQKPGPQSLVVLNQSRKQSTAPERWEKEPLPSPQHHRHREGPADHGGNRERQPPPNQLLPDDEPAVQQEKPAPLHGQPPRQEVHQQLVAQPAHRKARYHSQGLGKTASSRSTAGTTGASAGGGGRIPSQAAPKSFAQREVHHLAEALAH
eukprot:RCo044412